MRGFKGVPSTRNGVFEINGFKLEKIESSGGGETDAAGSLFAKAISKETPISCCPGAVLSEAFGRFFLVVEVGAVGGKLEFLFRGERRVVDGGGSVSSRRYEGFEVDDGSADTECRRGERRGGVGAGKALAVLMGEGEALISWSCFNPEITNFSLFLEAGNFWEASEEGVVVFSSSDSSWLTTAGMDMLSGLYCLASRL